MDKNSIGENAGMIWMLLNNNCRWTYDELKVKSQLSDRELNAAIGWLAREGNISFEMDNDKETLFLCVNVYIG